MNGPVEPVGPMQGSGIRVQEKREIHASIINTYIQLRSSQSIFAVDVLVSFASSACSSGYKLADSN